MGGGHGEHDIHGLDTPGAATALVARSYMERYGASPEDLANIAVGVPAERRRRTRWPIMRGKALTTEAYFEEPRDRRAVPAGGLLPRRARARRASS